MRPSSAVRPVLPRKAIVGLFATLVSIALLPSGAALADTVSTNFEPPGFTAGQSVNGQGGWKSAIPGDIPSLPHGYDQQVVANNGAPASFGDQSLRLSNAYSIGPENGPPEFHFQTYSKPTTDAAGEDLTDSVYTAQFSFISLSSQEQPRLQISVSPDMGEGGRMSFIGLNDTKTDKADGIDVTFYDTNADGDFVPYDLGILRRDKPHTIKFWMKLNPGPNNDLVRISIDGQDYGQCFTTWESFYRATHQDVPISDRLLFLVGNRDGDRLGLLGGGYLFDNVTTTTEGAGLPGCNDTIEKQVDVAHGDRRRHRGLPDHRPQSWPRHRPQPSGVRSRPAPYDIRQRQPQAAPPRQPALLRDPAPQRPANAPASTSCSAPIRTRRRARRRTSSKRRPA